MSETSFQRLSLRERGHFSNYFTLNPVLRLTFKDGALGVLRRSGYSEYPYASLHAEILKTYSAKGYGKSAYAYIPQTLVTLSSSKFICRFDLSVQFSDFREAPALLFLIKTNLIFLERIETLAVVKRKHATSAFVLVVVLGCAWLWAKRLGI